METFGEDVHKMISRFLDILDFRFKDIKGYEGNRPKYLEFFRELKKIEIEKLYIRFKNDFEFGGV